MYSMRGIAPRLSLSRSALPPLPLSLSSHRVSRPSKLFSLSHSRRASTMEDNVKQHYLADSPPSVVRLEIKSHFDALKDESLRKYAHYMSRYGVLSGAHLRTTTLSTPRNLS